MKDWKQRLTETLEPALKQPDPRTAISAYREMPYAMFQYPEQDEFAVREAITMLCTRLDQAGKQVTRISLAACLSEALAAVGLGPQALADAEKSVGLESTIDTIHHVLSEACPLDELVAKKIPHSADPLRDVVFIERAGALFPVYRTSSLLEQLKGKVHVPAVLFFPGQRDGAAGLRFMGVLDAEHNYRPKIF